jgi:AcrR family transcriptional regulator
MGRATKARRSKKEGRGKYDRGQTTAQRREEQRTRLILAAAQVFAAKGFANATVEAICNEAGMSRRTFYEIFEDLRDVLLQVFDHAANTAYRFVESAVHAQEDPISRVRAGVEALLTVISQQGDLTRVLFREIRAAGPRMESRHEAMIGRYVTLIFEGVADAHAKGFAKRPPDELTIFALVSAVEGVAMRYVARREEARAVEAAPTLTELFARAFR